MNSENHIVLITNDDAISASLKPRLVLLREVDSIIVSDFEQSINKITKSLPETIFLHATDQETTLNLLHEIKLLPETKNTSIILVLNQYDQDLVLNAYEEGITDYLTVTDDSAEVLMRAIWAIKKQELLSQVDEYKKLLQQLKIINSETGFYTEKFYKKVFENEFEKIQKKNIGAMFLALAPNEIAKVELKLSELTKAVKKSIRNSDVAALVNGNKIYILLFKTDLKGTFVVWERIKKMLGEDYGISGGVTAVAEKPFDKVEGEVVNALCEAVSTQNDLIVVSDETPQENWIDKINSGQKNFKLFKQAFNKKLEKVITPVFFQMQKAWEEKLFETKIDQYSNPSLSIFSLVKEGFESELKITYPGFSKLNIDITHKGLDTPENRRINLDLAEVDEAKLTQILEEFIGEFKNSLENS